MITQKKLHAQLAQLKLIEKYKYTEQMKVWADNIRRYMLKELLKLQIKEFDK